VSSNENALALLNSAVAALNIGLVVALGAQHVFDVTAILPSRVGGSLAVNAEEYGFAFPSAFAANSPEHITLSCWGINVSTAVDDGM